MPFLNHIFHDLGNIADIFLHSNILNYWDWSKNRVISLKLLKVMCCWIIPNSLIVKQLFFLELSVIHKRCLLFRNNFHLDINFSQLNLLYPKHPNFFLYLQAIGIFVVYTIIVKSVYFCDKIFHNSVTFT